MRIMGKTDVVSCQLSFYPLCTKECTAPVKEVVDLIEESAGIVSSVNDMSTIIKGGRKTVMTLLEDIQKRMEEKDIQYTMVITLSNICGCSPG